MDKSPRRILRLPEVLNKTGVGRSTLYSWMEQGLFPKQIKLGARCVGWLEKDVDIWISSKAI